MNINSDVCKHNPELAYIVSISLLLLLMGTLSYLKSSAIPGSLFYIGYIAIYVWTLKIKERSLWWLLPGLFIWGAFIPVVLGNYGYGSKYKKEKIAKDIRYSEFNDWKAEHASMVINTDIEKQWVEFMEWKSNHPD
jgi:hypothetical protein